MRMRYLHLPRCGPLTNTTVVFGRENLIEDSLGLPRKGSLNFVVGVNGSGKSSLLRAIYRIFRSLNLREWPALPVTVAWDRTQANETTTTILHSTNNRKAVSFFATMKWVPKTADRNVWESIIESLDKDQSNSFIDGLQIVKGLDAISDPLLYTRLPKHLVAYTSGSDDLWLTLDHAHFHPSDEADEEQLSIDDERPQGWSMDLEWKEKQIDCVERLLEQYTAEPGELTGGRFPGMQNAPLEEFRAQLEPHLEPLRTLQGKVSADRMPRAQRLDESYFRIRTRHLRYAGITMALWQTAKEMAGRAEESERESLRSLLLQQCGADVKPNDGRRVLNEINWFWPTHLSITYRDIADRVSPQQHQELLCLVALADEVLAQPLGRQRAVFSLGPSDRISLTQKLKDAFPLGIPGKTIEFIAERVEGCKTMAEAILRVFSSDMDLDSTPMDVFSRFRDWERTGLLEDLTLTVKRLHQTESSDGELDDTIITFDHLSDGEQMLLGRIGLLFLLRGQDGSLLLLDEPETHFNDVWKREIVDMIDMGLLNSTEANVIVSTHTSIALTDAFAAEVTVLDNGVARGVGGGLFGTDPGEVNMNIFRAESSTGSRSVEILDRLLKTDWKGRETELEAILDVLGSSFHRAELRAILKKLRRDKDGTASS